MILLIDNYDSFSYNLYQLLGELEEDIKVIRNDEMTIEEMKKLAPEKIVISPGPGRPEDAGIIIKVIEELGKQTPILGVCLGHQAICATYGATITYAKQLMHGKQTEILVKAEHPLFQKCSMKMKVARYHSLIADSNTVPKELEIIAETLDGEVMAVAHRKFPVYGVQFHPESIMTPDGKQMLENFMKEM